jgi:HPt (histidine-containing phosphotransfer) domain-containing protein
MNIESMAVELGLEVEEVHRLVLTFLESTEQDILRLRRAFSEGDAEKLGDIAHHIKGAAANLELNAIAEAARGIEVKARSGVLEDPAAPVQLIRDRLELIHTQVSPKGRRHGCSSIP